MTASYLSLQLFNGLVNGSFYALLSLGLAVVFGMLRVVNFAHSILYTLGAFVAYVLLQLAGVPFWMSLLLAPAVVGLLGVILERTLISRLYAVDPLYNFLLTFGLTLVLQVALRLRFGVQGQPYGTPPGLSGVANLGAVVYPTYRLFVILFAVAICVGVWLIIERTRVGMVIRAATEKPELTRALGIDVDRWVTPVFGFAVALAALAGVLPDVFSDDTVVRERAHDVWWIFVATMPANGAVFALDGILIGAGDTRYLMWSMLAAGLLVYVPVALLVLALDWGIVGVWCGFLGLIAVRLATCGARFAGRRWAVTGAPARA